MKTANPELVRAINRFHVMDVIRRFGLISRVEICERIELSPIAVSTITATLLDNKLIISGTTRAVHVVGVKLASDQISVAITDLYGKFLGALTLPIRVDRQRASVVADLVEDGVQRYVGNAELALDAIADVCVGLPGVVGRATGICRQSPVLSERDALLGSELARRLAAPVSIDGDVKLAALAEQWFRQTRDLNDFLVVDVERSLGLAILHNGEWFLDANGLSPDLGDFLLRTPGDGGGRFADVASEAAALADAGEAASGRALGKADEAPGYAIDNLITLFAPPKVMVSGPAMAGTALPRAFARDGGRVAAAESRERQRDRRAQVGRQRMAPRRGGDDVARSLRRAVEHDRPGAATRGRGTRGRDDMKRVKVGVIGCGNISAAYLKAAKKFPILDIVALADLDPEAAAAKSKEFGIPAHSVEKVLVDPKIEVILNLTIPKAHVEVGLQAIEAGKHVHSEKPLGVNVAEARRLMAAAEAKGLRLGSAPDTFLGGAQQRARACIDKGQIGHVVGGTAFFMCPGHERWHPSPAFYYHAGGGPMLDMGPYYVTALVNLLGPIAEVVGVATRTRGERLITSEPLKGQRIVVEAATHVTGIMRFESGAAVSITMSFDVLTHKHVPIEIYGEAGSLIVPDPNNFDGQVQISTVRNEWRDVATERPYADANYRILGLADMAHAIRTKRPHRAGGELAFHALEVMEAFQTASDTGRAVKIESRPARPEAMPPKLKRGELD